MAIGDSNVKRINNLLGQTTLGRKAAASALGMTLSTEDLAALERIAGPSTPTRRRASVVSGTWNAAAIWPAPTSAAIHLKDIIFSTDAALNLRLHQATMATYAAKILADGAAHHWQLDEASGTAADSIGAKTLTAVGAPTYAQPCLVTADGTAVDLNGSSSGFYTASPPASASAGAFEAWIYLDTYPASTANRYMQFSQSGTTSSALGVGVTTDANGGLPTLVMRSSAGSLVWNATGQYRIPLKTWTHIIWSHDGSGLVLYVNGTQRTVTYSTGSDANAQWLDDIFAAVTHFTIGFFREATDSSWFDGKVSNPAWYAAAVSEATAKAHYELGAPLWGPHYFGANSGTASPLGYEIICQSAAAIYATTSASASATLELIGYEA